jgi:branched-chain amino acid transport system substrate-binding protein
MVLRYLRAQPYELMEIDNEIGPPTVWNVCAVAAAALVSGPAFAQAGETVKIAWIDALTGLTAATGQNQLKGFQFLAERFGQKNDAGVKFEIVSFDNKLSPQETVNALQAAIDQGIRYVAQGTGTGPATAIIDFLNKHNERNPGKEVLFLNYAAVDPDADQQQVQLLALPPRRRHLHEDGSADHLHEGPEDVKKVYLINQNYAHGHQVAKYAKENLARKRPDIQIVGEDLHPLAQTRDFAPYIAKIKASGADTVITGNWGSGPDAAGQGRQRRRPDGQVLHLLRRRQRHAHGHGRQRRRPRLPGGLHALQPCGPRAS